MGIREVIITIEYQFAIAVTDTKGQQRNQKK